MSLQPYPNYYSVDYDYVQSLPDGWRLWKIAHAFNLIGSGTTPESGNTKFYIDGTINWINTGDLNNGVLENCKNKITEEALKKYSVLKIYPKGTLLIAMYGATIGKASVINIEGCTNQACCALSKSKVLTNKFTLYWFISNRKNIVNLSYGGGQPNISQDVIKKLKIPVPPLEIQNSIVEYLDKKNHAIDKFIQNKERLITLLEDNKKAIIKNFIGTGETYIKLKYLLKIQNGEGFSSDLVKNEGEFAVYGGNGILGYHNKYNVDDETLIIGRVGALCGNVHYTNKKVWVNDNAMFVKTQQNNKYMYYLLLNANLNSLSFANAQPLITGTLVKNHLTKFHRDIETQNLIVIKIEKKLGELNLVIEKAQKEIELIKEYRETLITDLVTGKRSIPQTVKN